MKRILLFWLLIFSSISTALADRIFIMNFPGYNAAEPQLVNAIIANGHTVVVSSTVASLPAGFTSTCVDPVNGYDWLCFFGPNDFSSFSAQVASFMSVGGKVYCQYEVSCCPTSSFGTATIVSSVTGLTITPNANPYIAFSGASAVPGWEAANVKGCVTFTGAAYKGLDGLPLANQLQATATLSGATPPISTCPNFGFFFPDVITSSTNGAICGMGDINAWYDSDEPFSNGGSTPVNMDIVDFFFPNCASTCYLFPPGCIGAGPPAGVTTLGNDTALCTGETLVLDVSSAGASYLWYDGSTGATNTVSSSGNFWVTITQGSCAYTDSILVSYIPETSLGSDTLLCPGDLLSLSAFSPGATYLWQDGSSSSSLLVNSPGNYWVQVNGSGCSHTDTVNIAYTFFNELGNDTLLCQGQSLVLDVTNPATTYLWQDGSTGPSITVSSPGLSWVQQTSAACVYTDSIVISYNTPVDLGNDTTLCPGQNILLNAGVSGGTYSWQDGSTGPAFPVSSSGLYWVIVMQGSCSASDSIVVSSLSNISIGTDTALCLEDTLVLNVSLPGATYLWQDGSSGSSNTITSSGTYWVLANASGCAFSDTIEVTYNSPVAIGNDTTVCEDQIIIVNATASGATYLWQDGSVLPAYTISLPGTYWVQVTDYCGIRYDSIVVEHMAAPSSSFSSFMEICSGQTITLYASAESGSYLWQDGSMANAFVVTSPGLYWVQAINVCGSINDTVSVSETDCQPVMVMPSVFTPNGDGENDLFLPVRMENIASATLEIYDRWGLKLFTGTDLQRGWDGTSGGNACSDGTYYWILRYTDLFSKTTVQKGFLSLIR